MFKQTDKIILGIDIGGSHISSALVNAVDGCVLSDTFSKNKLNTRGKTPKTILDQWLETIKESLSNLNGNKLQGIAVAMPGPFDYRNGISLLEGLDKYESLYGINIKTVIKNGLNLEDGFPILFENDAACFALGESIAGEGAPFEKVIAITLGTGFGASFIHQKKLLKEEEGIPCGGYLYNLPFKDGIAEDYISSRWLLKKYAELSGNGIDNVKEMAVSALADKDDFGKEVFKIFGRNLAQCLAPWIKSFKAGCLVIGGSISKSSELFLPALKEELSVNNKINVPIKSHKKWKCLQ